MENTILKAKSLSKYFHEPETFQVIKNISFDVNKGEFLAIMGKSGSGKSTLLYLLSTMDTDFTGELEMNGIDLTKKSQNELAAFRNNNIGFVFQFHYLLPDFTALENVMLPALKQGKKSKEEIREKAYELLKRFDLQDRAYNKASKLSGGQQQRVAVARALVNDPAIIMGDEPTGNLDTKNTNNLFGIFRELAEERGQTIIAVTHDDEFAANCDRILELSDGRIVSEVN
jgi:lipoprotein-releasing system ATP-binding protein